MNECLTTPQHTNNIGYCVSNKRYLEETGCVLWCVFGVFCGVLLEYGITVQQLTNTLKTISNSDTKYFFFIVCTNLN